MKAFGLELKKETLRPYVGPALALMVSFGLVVGLIIPRAPKIPELKKQEKQTQETLTKLAQKSKTLKNLASQKAILEADYAVMKDVLATDPEVPTLVDQVQKIATDSAVTVKSLNFSGEKKDKKEKEGALTELGVGISIEGVYDNVLAYLRAVEQAARVLKVKALRFTAVSGEGKSEAGNITTSVGLSSYYQPETAKASLESPVPADFQSKKYQDLLIKLRNLQVYRAIIDTSGVGKPDPFSR